MFAWVALPWNGTFHDRNESVYTPMPVVVGITRGAGGSFGALV